MSNRLQLLNALLTEQPNDEFLLFAIAKEHEKQGDENQALDFYQQLIAVNPNYVGVYYHLAKLYERQEATDKALETYAKGMEIARHVNDQHAFSELQNAKMNLELEL